MSRTVVIGGSGVVGTGIVSALVEAGMEVDVLDLTPPDCADPRVGFIEGDVRDPSLASRIAEHETIVVAFGRLARGLSEQPADAWQLNVEATLRLLAATRGGGRCRRFVFVSSAMVYDRGGPTGQLSGSICEDAPVRGRCIYSHSKLAVEHAIACAVAAGHAPTLVLRPFTVFGPGPMRGAAGHLVGRWLELARAGAALTIHGDGSQTVDLVPSSVLGAACLRFVGEAEPPPLRVLNGTCGRPLAIRALAELFCERFPGLGVEFTPMPAGTVPPSQTWGDATALSHYLGPASALPDPSAAMRVFLQQVELPT